MAYSIQHFPGVALIEFVLRRRLSLGIVLTHGGAFISQSEGARAGIGVVVMPSFGDGDDCSLSKRMSAEGAGRVIRRSQGSMTAVGRWQPVACEI